MADFNVSTCICRPPPYRMIPSVEIFAIRKVESLGYLSCGVD